MAALSFTACDSLIPNDLPTEEENTQGGNDNPGGSDGTEDETPTIVHNQKIVKLLSDEDGNLISTYNTDGSYGELAYYDILYDLNIDIQFLGNMYYIGYCGYDGYLPVLKPLPGITSRNCLKRATRTDADGSILDVEYEYTLDSDGNISKIKLSGMMTYITNGIQHEAPLGEGVLCVKY